MKNISIFTEETIANALKASRWELFKVRLFGKTRVYYDVMENDFFSYKVTVKSYKGKEYIIDIEESDRDE